jgi:NTP pyrophosphatase (non-canonical NTP hydrolase)
MTTIAEWQREAHNLAVSKGFHTGSRGEFLDPFKPSRIASRLALIHCEISEAVECVAKGEMQLYHVPTESGHKPEGFGVELADVFLRLCDFAEALQFTIPTCRAWHYLPNPAPEELAAELAYLHAIVSECSATAAEFHSDWAGRVLSKLRAIAESVGVDLFATAALKHEYNKTRSARHGGKVL